MSTFGPYEMLLDFAFMSVLLFIAQFLRAKIKLIQNLYLPSSLLAGVAGLLLGPQFANVIPFTSQAGSYPYLLVVVLFATLFIGNSEKQSLKKVINDVGDTFTLNMAAEFGQFGIALLVGGFIMASLFPEVTHVFSLLMPAGFVGGHGYAAAIGGTLEQMLNWDEAVTIGQTFATFGLLTGVFGGIVLINIAIRNGSTRLVKSMSQMPESMRTGLVPENERSVMGEDTINPMAMDPLSWHVLLVLIAVLGGYYASEFSAKILPGITLPMMSLSMLAGVILQFILNRTGFGKYVDKRIITRIGSSASDYLLAFGVATIKISVVIKYALPILVLCILGFTTCLFFVYGMGRKLFHNFWFERSIFIYGWTTGVVAIGVTLLRIVDPEFKSKTLEDYGMAYVFISIVEVFIVSITPVFISQGWSSVYIGGAVLTAIFLALMAITAIKYGINKQKVNELRVGEEEIIKQYMKEKSIKGDNVFTA
ncbi:sodium/glutamate symporter [Lutispora sp.]|uniref:sodium/glutamate symporter n=1 Tax=Lutispora sp. TaxID=2828727 RepID=UPI003568E8A5